MPLAKYTCSKCGRDVSWNDVSWNGSYIKSCRFCKSSYDSKYRLTPKGRLVMRGVNFKRKYSLSVNEFDSMKLSQDNCCLVCKRNFDIVKPVIDHNHSTNEVRGILCYSCNSAIGHLQENEDIIWNVLEYLKKTTWDRVV